MRVTITHFPIRLFDNFFKETISRARGEIDEESYSRYGDYINFEIELEDTKNPASILQQVEDYVSDSLKTLTRA